ncbi:hypothetical protein [Microcoleus sp. bin38.metabat.b11b12b14.051]|nr:hypothetical protein [Microcoleus sp. bin38.metabat.b11b12b14.051]
MGFVAKADRPKWHKSHYIRRETAVPSQKPPALLAQTPVRSHYPPDC